MSREKFKTMFISVNDRMRTFIPTNISYLSACLKKAGFSTCLFDTSFYAEQERLNDEQKKEDAGFFEPVDYSALGVYTRIGLIDALLSAVSKEKPQLIGFSVFSQSKKLNLKLAKCIKDEFKDISVIFGGIHVNIEPYEILSQNYIDYICLGEGEEAIVDLVMCLSSGNRPESIKNIGLKINGQIQINPLRKPTNLDNIPFPDWDLFNPYHLYGPFRGKLQKIALIEYSRTCPYNCTYCGNSIVKNHYRSSQQKIGYRYRSPQCWISDLKRMKGEYGIEIMSITDGTFLAQSERNLEQLAGLYKNEIDLPFWCDGTVYCITPKKAKLLKDMGCICLNMGIETANEQYRKRNLNRGMTNKKIIDAFLMAKEYGLKTRSYNIIGLPFQTREDIMDTIELNRQCQVDSLSLAIFVPYEGTVLREYCIKKNLMDPHAEIAGDGTEPIISNPYLSDDELRGLFNTFLLYVTSPRELFPKIRKAETDTTYLHQLKTELAYKMKPPAGNCGVS